MSNESLVTSRAKQALDNFHKSSNDPLSTHEGTIETNELDNDDDMSKPNSKVRPFSPEFERPAKAIRTSVFNAIGELIKSRLVTWPLSE